MPRTRLQDSQAVKPLPRGMYDWEYDNFKRHHPQCEPTYKDLAVASGFKPFVPAPLFKIEKHQSPFDVIKEMSQDIQENEEEVQQPLLPKKRVTFELVEEEKKPQEKKQQWPEWWVKIPYCDQEDIAAWRREHLSQCYGATFKQALPFLIKQLGEKVAKCKALNLQQFFAWSKQRSNDNYDDIIKENEEWFKYGPKKRDAKGQLKNELKQTKLIGWLENNKHDLEYLLENQLRFSEVKKWVRNKTNPVLERLGTDLNTQGAKITTVESGLKVFVTKRIEEAETKTSFRMTNICASMAQKERDTEERIQTLISEQKDRLSSAFNNNMEQLQRKVTKFETIDARYTEHIEQSEKVIDALKHMVLKNKHKMEEMSVQIIQLKEDMQKLKNCVSVDATLAEDVCDEDILQCLSQI